MADNSFESLFRKLCGQELEPAGVALNDSQVEQFKKYYELLIQWNQVMNLTAITEMEDVIVKHFADSLSLVLAVDDFRQYAEKKCAVIDVGTGAGFPGIPLKIAFPELRLTLLDSLNKRVKFLGQICDELNLKNVRCIHGRAEESGRDPELREQFDFAVSRAVANLSTLSEYCIPFVKPGGYFVPYKSSKLDEEMKNGRGAVKKLGGEIENVIDFILPCGDPRTLVKIRKVKATDKKYPRKAGVPGKEPLC